MHPTREPTAGEELVFADLVVPPEAVAVLLPLVVDAGAWGHRLLLAFGLMFTSSVLALVRVASLTATEVAGTASSAVTGRGAPPVAGDPAGPSEVVGPRPPETRRPALLTVQMESVIQIVRTGVRMRLVGGTCGGLCAMYVRGFVREVLLVVLMRLLRALLGRDGTVADTATTAASTVTHEPTTGRWRQPAAIADVQAALQGGGGNRSYMAGPPRGGLAGGGRRRRHPAAPSPRGLQFAVWRASVALPLQRRRAPPQTHRSSRTYRR